MQHRKGHYTIKANLRFHNSVYISQHCNLRGQVNNHLEIRMIKMQQAKNLTL
jgi:hypothetical protein